MAGHSALRAAAFDAASRQQYHRQQLLGLSAYDRHKRLMHDLQAYYGGTLPAAAVQEQGELPKTDFDILRENYRCALCVLYVCTCALA